MDRSEWLAGLVAGDEVFVTDTYGLSGIAKLERTTKAQVMLGQGRAYWRKNGEMVGMAADHVWNRSTIRPVQESDRMLIQQRELRKELQRALADERITLPELKAMKEALDSIRVRMQGLRKGGQEKDK